MELFTGIIIILIFIILSIIGIFIIDFLPEKVAEILIEAVPIIGFFTILILLWFISKVINVLHKIKKQNAPHDTPISQEEQ